MPLVKMPDGQTVNMPDELTPELATRLKALQDSAAPSTWDSIKQGAGNLAAGAVRGAGSIGATILAPIDAAARFANDGKPIEVNGYQIAGHDRRTGMDEGFKMLGAEPDSAMYKTGKIGGEIAGTAGIGGALAPVAELGNAAKLAQALRASGFAKDVSRGTNMAGGAIAGGASAALVDPSAQSTGIGAGVGAVIPPLGAAAARVAQPLLARMGNKAAIEAIAERSARSAAGNDADRQFAIKAMNNAQTYVPGATPTAGEAIAGAQVPGTAQGGGILALQRGLHGHEGAVDVLPGALAKQDEALSASLRPFAGGATKDAQAAALEAAKQLRSSSSGAAYQELNSVIKPVDSTLGKILDLDVISKVIPMAKQIHQVDELAAEQAGKKIAPFVIEAKKPPITDFATGGAMPQGGTPAKVSLGALQYVKAALDKAAADPATATAMGIQANSISSIRTAKSMLTNWMEKASPEWAAARDAYKAESIPINQLQFNQGLASKLQNASGDTTGRTFLNAMDSGVSALEKKAGIPRAAGGPANYLDPANEHALSGIQSHLGRQADMARMLRNIQGSSEASAIGAGAGIPHVSREGIVSDLLFRSLVGGGENTKRFMAESLADPQKFAALLRGLPDNQKLEATRRLMQQGAVIGTPAALSK